MKILLAYDGSKSSEAAIDDIALAGLPAEGEAIVMSVAEVWLPPRDNSAGADEPAEYPLDADADEMLRTKWRHGEALLNEADAMAKHARKRVEQLLPGWSVDSFATYGSPAWEVIVKADEFRPDLVLAGSQGRSALGRLVLGSISQKILTEAKCSVRIGRGRIQVDEAPVRVMIAFDGSAGAEVAVAAAGARNWPRGSEFCLVSAAEQLVPASIGRFIPPVSSLLDGVDVSLRDWLKERAEAALKTLQMSAPTTFRILAGHPKQVLVEEAERLNADCIFLGAKGAGTWSERFLLGSTSSAVAARAHCSVEVVRTPSGGQ